MRLVLPWITPLRQSKSLRLTKCVNKEKDITVNSKLPDELRRVDFHNMIYIADGPSDIPAFSVVKGRGGANICHLS